MKASVKTTIKFISISILLSCFTLAIYASNTYPNENMSKAITQKSKVKTEVIVAQLDEPEIIESEKPIEDWMLDENFWKIKNDWEIEPIEEEKPIEDWMDKFTIKKTSHQLNYNNNEWMKKYSFYIL